MHISQLITQSRVVSDLVGTSKVEVLTTLSTLLADDLPLISPDTILDTFLEREKLGSTGVGKGIAVPHGRIPQISVPIVAMGRSQQGVLFDALDGQPVYLLAALLSPLRANKAHLDALSVISRLLHQQIVREQLRAAPDQAAFYALLTSNDSYATVATSGDGH